MSLFQYGSEAILAIDPGTTQSAFVVGFEDRLIDKGIIANEEVWDYWHRGFSHDGTPIGLVSIEMIASYGMPVGKEVFETCVFIGRIMERFTEWECDVPRVYRKDIKMHLCGSMRAKDSNIRQALIDKYGRPGTKANPNPVYCDESVKMKKDIWSALAVLDYTSHLIQVNELVVD